MKERPILFTGPMVRAILDGRKTVTRRVMKPKQAGRIAGAAGSGMAMEYLGIDNDGCECFSTLKCPYGQPGDRLWVRETWHVGKPHDKTAPADILAPLLAEGRGITVLYTAGGWQSVGPAGREEPIYPDDQPLPDWAGKGRPSIHMPRWASRILLEVTAVRVERLQDISEDQAEAEGTQGCVPYCQSPYDSDGAPACDCMNLTYKESFQALWSSINGAASWDANPWVWVVEFKRVTP